jgi:hypothetical protein
VAILSTDAAAPPLPVAVGGPEPLPTSAVAGIPQTRATAVTNAASKPLKRMKSPSASLERDLNKQVE